MRMHIACIDDSLQFQEEFRSVISPLLSSPDELECFSDSRLFLKASPAFDAAFLDIEMEPVSGIGLMEQMHDAGINIPVVFVSSHPEYVFRSFGMNVIGFIEKDKLQEELPRILQKIHREMQLMSAATFQDQQSAVSIAQNDILFCDMVGRKVYLHTKENSIPVSGTLESIYKKTDPQIFIYVNRSCFVNMTHAVMIDKNDIYISGVEKPMEISRYRRKDVLAKFIALRKERL